MATACITGCFWGSAQGLFYFDKEYILFNPEEY